MLRSRVHFQLRILRPAKTSVRDHAPHRFPDQTIRMFRTHFLRRFHALTAAVSRPADVFLARFLVAGQEHLVGIDYDHDRSRIHMGRKGGEVFPAKRVHDLHRKTAQRLIGGIEQQKTPFDLTGLRQICLHFEFHSVL